MTLDELQKRLDELTARVTALEENRPRPVDTEASLKRTAAEEDSSWSLAEGSKLLPRVATVSFMLVIALVLRTVTDAGMIEPRLGVVLGMGYAALLIAWGWRACAKRVYGRRVFGSCGALLMCALLLETEGRFLFLSAPVANLILFGTLAALTWIGLRYRVPLNVEVATLSTTLTSVSIGFPDPQFPHTAAVVLLANVAAGALLRVARRPWLQWVILCLTLFFWLMWTFKLWAPLSRSQEILPSLYLEWFLPALAVFFVTWLVLAARRVASSPASPGLFSLALPTTNLAWAFAAATAVVVPWLGGIHWLGAIGVVASVGHLGLAGWLWRHGHACEPGVLAFAFAAILSFVPSTILAIGDLTVTVPLWAVAALAVARLSTIYGSGGIRLTSYVLQAGACAVAVLAGEFDPSAGPIAGTLVAGMLALAAALHYRWSRATPPAPSSWYGKIAPADPLGIPLLWVSVLAGFCVLRVITHAGLATLPIDVDNAFQGTQSVIINVMAIALMVLGLIKRDKELLGTAVLAAVVGGLRVFTSDLFTAHGVPLVLSVFSFGMAAAVGSVVLGRWQRSTATGG
jgi:hypothetical protein